MQVFDPRVGTMVRNWVFPIYPAKLYIKTSEKNIKLQPKSKFGQNNFLSQNFQILRFSLVYWTEIRYIEILKWKKQKFVNFVSKNYSDRISTSVVILCFSYLVLYVFWQGKWGTRASGPLRHYTLKIARIEWKSQNEIKSLNLSI